MALPSPVSTKAKEIKKEKGIEKYGNADSEGKKKNIEEMHEEKVQDKRKSEGGEGEHKSRKYENERVRKTRKRHGHQKKNI